MKIKPSSNRAVIKVLVQANEKKTSGGIIIPEAKNVTKEMAIGEVIDINDVDNVACAVKGDVVYFRSMSLLECGDGIGIINVLHIDGVIEK